MAKSKNRNLTAAKAAKKDEFYTQLSDIENELKHYSEHFRGKTVLCNCDDPYESNFFKYFALNFNRLGLKRLIATCYDSSPLAFAQGTLFADAYPEGGKRAYVAILDRLEDVNGDGAEDLRDVFEILRRGGYPKLLEGNGDFRSPECVEYLKEADIVVTNPPFSLFREYVAQLVEYGKKFLVIGNVNAITYKEIFPLIRENKLWPGYRFNKRVGGKNMTFLVPEAYEMTGTELYVDDAGRKFISVAGTGWFTNLEHRKRHEPLILYKPYSPEDFPKYDNYDAIEVSRTAEIPVDYDGVMGVPITFLDKYCPEQFEILGNGNDVAWTRSVGVAPMGQAAINNLRRQGNKAHVTANMTAIYYTDQQGNVKLPYGRIMIRKRKIE